MSEVVGLTAEAAQAIVDEAGSPTVVFEERDELVKEIHINTPTGWLIRVLPAGENLGLWLERAK